MTVNTRKLGYTTSEAARRLGVSLSTIRRWSDMGYLRGYRTPGGQRRFSVQQLDEFLVSLESDGRRSGGEDGGAERVHHHHDEPVVQGLHEHAAATERDSGQQFWPPARAV